MSDSEAYALGGECPAADLHVGMFRCACGWEADAVPEPEPEPRPSVGRIVHFRAADGEGCWAAIVTEVVAGGDSLFLTVFPPDGLPGYLSHPAPLDGNGWQGHTWHWPERS